MSLTDKFDRNRGKFSGKFSDATTEEAEIENYVRAGTMRNICFVLLDKRREFFNYGDLTRCSYDPNQSQITLTFRGFASVFIKGFELETLYEKLQGQIPRQIVCKEDRYKELRKEKEIYVTEIIVMDTQIL